MVLVYGKVRPLKSVLAMRGTYEDTKVTMVLILKSCEGRGCSWDACVLCQSRFEYLTYFDVVRFAPWRVFQYCMRHMKIKGDDGTVMEELWRPWLLLACVCVMPVTCKVDLVWCGKVRPLKSVLAMHGTYEYQATMVLIMKRRAGCGCCWHVCVLRQARVERLT